MCQQRLRFEKIVNVAKSMDSLVNQLLFLARHEGRLAAESLKEIDLTIWLQELADNHAPDAAKHLSLQVTCRSIQSRWKLTQTCYVRQ